MGQVDDEFGLGPQWARGTTCCGKPAGCTNMSDQCLMKNHPWKRCNNVPELAGFVAARLAEDEHIARMAAEDASASPNWHVDARYEHSGHAGVSGENGEIVVYDEGSPAQMEAEHIARHDPARVLREIEAKRAILTVYIKAEADGTSGDGWVMLRFAVEMLAAAWSDHPGYQPGWALAQVRSAGG